MVYQLAPVCLLNAPTDAGTKLDVLFDQPQGSILHQLFGVGAHIAGDSRKMGFLLRGEVYFYRFQSKDCQPFCQ